jgi:2,3-dihydroxybenzoate decarboxylase
MYAIGKLISLISGALLIVLDTPYDTVEEAQSWWKSIDLSDEQKEAVGRRNAIRLFKLPIEE